jgi:hypothetical protein
MALAAALLAASLGMPTAARADYGDEAGWGVLTMLANVGYMPVKFAYATLGGLTGGLAYVCTGGSFDTANAVWSTSLGGTYVLTPAMIRGEESIAFTGTGPLESPTGSSGGTAQDEHQLREQGLPPS